MNQIKNRQLDLNFFKKAIDRMREFDEKLKCIHFGGAGEPLINKNVAKMIEFAKKSGVAENIDIFTNRILLDQKNSDLLLDSGVDFIRISVNGLSGMDFEKNTDFNLNFEKYIENISYLYKRKNQD